MQNISPEDSTNHTVFPPLASAASDVQSPRSPQSPQSPAAPTENPAHAAASHSLFYTQDQDDDLAHPFHNGQDDPDEQDEQDAHASPLVLPFQHSAPLPPLTQTRTQISQTAMGPSPSSASVPGKPHRFSLFSLRLVKLFLIVSVVLITVIGASLLVFAQSAPPQASQAPAPSPRSQTNGAGAASVVSPTQPPQATAQPSSRPTPQPTPQPTPRPSSPARATPTAQPEQTPTPVPPQNGGQEDTTPSPVPSATLLRQLGWTQAGLSGGDAVEALRTATTFTDREMSYDYRNIGTPARHGGTLTGATFLLTEGGKQRFAQHDRRVINQTLYNTIRAGKIIQQVVTPHPALVRFQQVQVQGQLYAIAWVNVTFTLFQAKTDAASGKRTEGLEVDPASGQPRRHQMAVVLLRVAPQNQGANAPMGGTGWLVNTYALDSATLPALATTPTL